ncbi:hypothetical protein Q9966_008195 [Columba livia]|nr:hypothetical protein Q9966_008195 [Columba livia]
MTSDVNGLLHEEFGLRWSNQRYSANVYNISGKDAFAGSDATQDERIREGDEGHTGEKSSLIAAKADEKGPSSTIVLDYAHRLSREILDQAVKQWAVTESKYSDIPFIESDVP